MLAFYIIIKSGKKKLLDRRTLRGPFMYYKIIEFLLKNICRKNALENVGSMSNFFFSKMAL